jgi:hypothetical protein
VLKQEIVHLPEGPLAAATCRKALSIPKEPLAFPSPTQLALKPLELHRLGVGLTGSRVSVEATV